MDFGKTPEGTPVELFMLRNGHLTVKVMTYGGIVQAIEAPDRDGKVADVVLGFDDLAGYLAGHPYFGATVGRVANRIAKGMFTLDGKEYRLAVNNGPNSLHGGLKGFDKAVWKVQGSTGGSLKLSHRSPDGDEGYPGTLDLAVTFSVGEDDSLRIDYEATTDQATPLNLTNHSYFNLAGPASGDILKHVAKVEADSYTPVDANLIPTGEIAPVRGTPLDFNTPTVIGERFAQLTGEPRGYDHNFVVRGGGGAKPVPAATVFDPKSGRVLEASTTEPGMQLYTGNFINGTLKGKGGVVYNQYQGFCLEAQHFPDSANQPAFPTTILRPGATYRQTTVYKFSAR